MKGSRVERSLGRDVSYGEIEGGERFAEETDQVTLVRFDARGESRKCDAWRGAERPGHVLALFRG